MAETAPDTKQPINAEDAPGVQAASTIQAVAYNSLAFNFLYWCMHHSMTSMCCVHIHSCSLLWLLIRLPNSLVHSGSAKLDSPCEAVHITASCSSHFPDKAGKGRGMAAPAPLVIPHFGQPPQVCITPVLHKGYSKMPCLPFLVSQVWMLNTGLIFIHIHLLSDKCA